MRTVFRFFDFLIFYFSIFCFRFFLPEISLTKTYECRDRPNKQKKNQTYQPPLKKSILFSRIGSMQRFAGSGMRISTPQYVRRGSFSTGGCFDQLTQTEQTYGNVYGGWISYYLKMRETIVCVCVVDQYFNLFLV